MDPVIRTYGLTKNYGRRQALQGVDVEVLAPAYGWLALTAAVFVAVAIPIFDRRDITVH